MPALDKLCYCADFDILLCCIMVFRDVRVSSEYFGFLIEKTFVLFGKKMNINLSYHRTIMASERKLMKISITVTFMRCNRREFFRRRKRENRTFLRTQVTCRRSFPEHFSETVTQYEIRAVFTCSHYTTFACPYICTVCQETNKGDLQKPVSHVNNGHNNVALQRHKLRYT